MRYIKERPQRDDAPATVDVYDRESLQDDNIPVTVEVYKKRLFIRG